VTYPNHNARGIRASFQTDGFVCDPGVLLSRQIHDLLTMAESGIAYASKANQLPLEKMKSLTSAWGINSTFVKAMVTAVMPQLKAVASKVAEVQPQPVDATLFIKSPWVRSATHAHQDIAYRWNREPEARYGLTTWLALDDICLEKGGVLSFLPGSHYKKISVRQDFLASDFRDHATSDEWAECAIPVPVTAGDVLIFDAQTWHAADAFTGQGARRVLAVRWSYADQYERRIEIPVPLIDSECFGIDTSGGLLLDAFFRAYPTLPVFEQADTLAEKIEVMLDWCSSNNEPVCPLAQQVLEDLVQALKVESTHGARSNPDLWLAVRDRVIPALSARFEKRRSSHE